MRKSTQELVTKSTCKEIEVELGGLFLMEGGKTLAARIRVNNKFNPSQIRATVGTRDF